MTYITASYKLGIPNLKIPPTPLFKGGLCVNLIQKLSLKKGLCVNLIQKLSLKKGFA
jgi:hypothetical protein